MSVSDDRLRQIANRFAELEARLASGTLEGAEFVAASRDYAELEPVAKAASDVADMRGGSAAPMVHSGCMLRLTRDRTQQLKELVEFEN